MNELTMQSNPADLFENLMIDNKIRQAFLTQRKVFLWGAVNDESAKRVTNELLFLEATAPGEEITLYINSPGGVVTSGMVIYDAMQMMKSPVATVCIGLAASMGSLILSGGTKGKRSIWPSGRVMIHQPSIGGHLFGQASDLEIQAREILKTKEMGAKILATNCNKPLERVLADFERDYWMNSEESLAYGIVDHIANQTGF
jgi:ATP-dependent Clp protease, protease subunit